MYGPTGKEIGCWMLMIAVIGGAACVGLEHVGAWLWHHLSVGWK